MFLKSKTHLEGPDCHFEGPKFDLTMPSVSPTADRPMATHCLRKAAASVGDTLGVC